MDPRTIDRISRIVGVMSRRRAMGAAGAALGASLLGGPERTALAASRDAMKRRVRAVAAHGVSLSPAAAPEPRKSSRKPTKCKPCADCDCMTTGGYIYGSTDTLCVTYYDDGPLQNACKDAGLECAGIAGACRDAGACIDQFFSDWFGV
jgi:hypothetical protein